jgi:hypothetical protein
MERRLLDVDPTGTWRCRSPANAWRGSTPRLSRIFWMTKTAPRTVAPEDSDIQRGKPRRHNISIAAISCLLYCAAAYVSLQ